MGMKYWEGYIYKITYIPTGQIYIGQAIGSWKEHKRLNEHFVRNSQLIERYIKFKGSDNFIGDVIETIEMYSIKGDFKARLDNAEKYWIEYYDSYECGFNLTKGGSGSFGRTPSQLNRQMFVLSSLGKPHSSEHNRKISQSMNGHIVSNDTRMKMRLSHKDKHRVYDESGHFHYE